MSAIVGREAKTAEAGPSIPQRILWQDTARGIGIALVVFGHIERGLRGSGILTAKVWPAIDFALYTFHMPLFMVLAGLNVPHSLRRGRAAFLRNKLLTILYPYLLWSLIHGSVTVALGRFTNAPLGPGDLLAIGWRPISPFWFLYALFLFMVLAAALDRRLFGILCVIGFLAGERYGVDTFVHQLLHFPLFFFAGMLLGGRRSDLRLTAGQAALGVLLAGATIALAIHAGLRNYNSVLMLPAAVGGIVAISWVAQRAERLAWLAALGSASLAVYVMHVLAGAGTRILLARLLHLPPLGALYLAACTAAGLVVPLIADALLARMSLRPVLGLAVGRRGRAWISGGHWMDTRVATGG